MNWKEYKKELLKNKEFKSEYKKLGLNIRQFVYWSKREWRRELLKASWLKKEYH